ncbi:hypothetical protein CAP35_04140 [Chitinophagaceae bacterium IBVUCB1]|nr:hypothetical protein CAP35_04140 [Chitinophagaceae bacterium IBVUCB1]
MSFLYPFFLLAGLTLAIPVLIHLFNLRRYKTVMFPHTRFLKSIQLKSQKQSQLKYKWLLALRLLFLTALILAFAQPFFSGNKQDTTNRLQVIYLDNSGSMAVKKGTRTLFETARDAAREQVRHAPAGTRFVLLTNDKPLSYQPLPADKVLTLLNTIDISANSKTADKTLAMVNSIMQGESFAAADVYYYSDFQQSSFPAVADKNLLRNIRFYGVPVQAASAGNVLIDTAYLDAPVLQTGVQNKLIVHSRIAGEAPKENPVLQLAINGQVKSASALRFNDKNESTDTLSFSVNDANWQRMVLSINDASVRFDDTFRISARSTPSLQVLVMNEGQPNPYIQAAFRAYNGFQLTQTGINQNSNEWKQYNLIIFNGITRMDAATGKAIAAALQEGQNICIFPARAADVAAINTGLSQITDIRMAGIDTATQAASALQQGSDLVRDMFERIPDNIQLPVANWHYIIDAGLSANQQAVLSFRSGSPMLAKYTPSKGSLYISAVAADMQSGNFAGSYFFVPFLYQMAIQCRGGDIYALTLGRQQAAFIPFEGAGERNMAHIYGSGIDAIPPQRPAGKGLEVFPDAAVQQAGFYRISASGSDTALVAINNSREESALNTWAIGDLKKQWDGSDIYWLSTTDISSAAGSSALGSFPLWKVCAILALLMLAAETYVLAGGFRKQAAATQ